MAISPALNSAVIPQRVPLPVLALTDSMILSSWLHLTEETSSASHCTLRLRTSAFHSPQLYPSLSAAHIFTIVST